MRTHCFTFFFLSRERSRRSHRPIASCGAFRHAMCRDAGVIACVCKDAAGALLGSKWYSAVRIAPGGLVLEPANGAFDVTVAPGEDVQAAVDRCPAGGCVLLLPGLHNGPLVLAADKVVHVFGRGLATLRAATGTVVKSEAATSTLDGLVIRRDAGGTSDYDRDCVWIKGGRLRLHTCDITSANPRTICVAVEGGADPLLAACRYVHYLFCPHVCGMREGLWPPAGWGRAVAGAFQGPTPAPSASPSRAAPTRCWRPAGACARGLFLVSRLRVCGGGGEGERGGGRLDAGRNLRLLCSGLLYSLPVTLHSVHSPTRCWQPAGARGLFLASRVYRALRGPFWSAIESEGPLARSPVFVVFPTGAGAAGLLPNNRPPRIS